MIVLTPEFMKGICLVTACAEAGNESVTDAGTLGICRGEAGLNVSVKNASSSTLAPSSKGIAGVLSGSTDATLDSTASS